MNEDGKEVPYIQRAKMLSVIAGLPSLYAYGVNIQSFVFMSDNVFKDYVTDSYYQTLVFLEGTFAVFIMCLPDTQLV